MKPKTFLITTLIFLAVAGVAWYLIPVTRTYEHNEMVELLKSGVFEQKAIIGSYKMKVKLPLNRETTVKYVVPIDENGKPLPSASNIIFYAPYNGDKGENVEKIDWIIPFVAEFGYSVFSMSIKADTEITNDPENYYIYQEAGWYDVIAEVQQRLLKGFSLESHPLIAVGQSSGGSLIQQMLVAKPGWIDIAAWCGGSRYTNWTQSNQAALLVLNTWGCYGTIPTNAMVKDLDNAGGECLRTYTPLLKANDFHSVGATGQRLIQLFVRDMINLRTSSQNLVRSYSKLSDDFYVLWNALPNNLFDENTENCAALKIFPMIPPTPERIVWLITESNTLTNHLGIMLNSFSELSKQNTIVIWNQINNRFLENPEASEQILAKILEKPEWGNLPIYIAGNGLGGQIAAVTALKNDNQRIKGIITLDSVYDYPFEQSSITLHKASSNIPITMCFTENIHDELPENITVKVIQRNTPASNTWSQFIGYLYEKNE